MLTVRNARLPIVRGGATVGLETGDAVTQHALRTDADVNATGNDIQKWVYQINALVSKRVNGKDPSFPSCVLNGPASGCRTDVENEVVEWIGTPREGKPGQTGYKAPTGVWNAWVARWKDYVSNTLFTSFDEDELKKWDQELAAHRRYFAEHGGLLATPVTPEFKKEVGSDGLGDPIAKVGDSIKNIVYMVGIGGLIFFGLFWVAPLFIGAASRTKQAGHDYSRIGKD